MAARNRRADARRKGEGRGPVILRFEPLEGRTLLSLPGQSLTDAADVTPITTPEPATIPIVQPDSPVIYSITSQTEVPVTSLTPTTLPTTEPATPLTTTTVTDPSLAYQTTVTPDPVTTSPALRPDLVLLEFDSLHNLDWGQTFRAAGKIRNQGPGTAPAGVEIDVYASTTRALTGQAVYVGTVKLTQPIAPGQEVTFNEPMDAPPSPITGLRNSPSYYLVPVVDPGALVPETSESNNGGSISDPASMVTITTYAKPRVVGSQFSLVPINSGEAYWGGTLQAVAQFTNTTAGTTAQPTRARVVIAPQGQLPDSSTAVTIGEFQVPALAAGATATVRGSVYLKPQAPTLLAGHTQFSAYIVSDADYLYRPPQSNTEVRGAGLDTTTVSILAPPSTPVTTPPRADITVTEVKPLASTAAWSQSLQVTTTVQNKGAADSGQLRVRFLLADSNRPYDPSLALADAVIDNLPIGQTQTITQTLNLQGKLPNNLRPEDIAGRIIVYVDPENAIDETSEANNGMSSGAILLKMPTRNDVPGVATPTTPTTPIPTTPTTPTTNPTPTRPNLRLFPRARRPVALPQRPQRPTRPHPTPATPRKPLATPRVLAQRPNLRLYPNLQALRASQQS